MGALGGTSRMGREGPPTDGGLSRHGVYPVVDVRPLPDRGPAGLRRPDRLGRIKRDRVRQLSPGGTHGALSRPAGHLRRHHGARTRRGTAPDREPGGAGALPLPRYPARVDVLGRALSGARTPCGEGGRRPCRRAGRPGRHAVGGPAEGSRRRRRVVRSGGPVPLGGGHPRGAEPGGGLSGEGC